MTFAIYYRLSDGEILGWTDTRMPVAPAGMLLSIMAPFDPDPTTQKFDTANGVVVPKSLAEIFDAQLPTPRDVAVAVFNEMRRTDPVMMPDYPLSGGEKHAWTVYRQGLRELAGDVATMINAWPVAPDGVDPISDLRERVLP